MRKNRANKTNARDACGAPGKAPEVPKIRRDLEAAIEFYAALEPIAGHNLPRNLHWAFVTPSIICIAASKDAHIAPAAESKKWAKVAEHIEEVRQSLTAAHYHIDNVRRIEAQLDELVQKYALQTPMARNGSHWNPSVTNKLTFEYHAFAMVSVSCLTYVSFTIGRVVFGGKSPTLKSLAKALDAKSGARGRGPKELLRILRAHEAQLSQMFTDKIGRSIRDEIAHESFLPAGSLKITGGEARLLGLVETRASKTSVTRRTEYRLSGIMERQFKKLEGFIREVLAALEKHCLPEPFPST